MPSNLIKLSSSEMEPDFHSRTFSDSERSGSFNSQGSRHSRSRSSNLDDENLKYLTSEEKNALLFFEETLDAFEDDIEEPPGSQDNHFGYYSISTEGSHSENEDIIDLVQAEENLELHTLPNSQSIEEAKDVKQTQMNTSVPMALIHTASPVTIPPMASPKGISEFPEFPIEHKKLLGAIPTPVVIAKKISEKNSDNLSASPLPPSEGKPTELKRSVATSPIGEGHFMFTGPPNSKHNNFPNNISIKQVGKQYNKTIAKAAVNVQERKAKVLANISGPSSFDDETDRVNYDRLSRKTSFRDVTTEQARYEALTKLGLVKETTVQAGIPTSPVSNGPISPKFLLQDSHKRYSHESPYISNSIKNEPIPFAHSKILPHDSPNRYLNENQNISSVKSEPSPLETSKSLQHEYTRLSIEKQNTSNMLKTEPSLATSPKSLPYEYSRSENQNVFSSIKSGPISPRNVAHDIPRTYSSENQNISSFKSGPTSPRNVAHDMHRTYLNEAQNSSSIKSGPVTPRNVAHDIPRTYSNENQNSSSYKSGPTSPRNVAHDMHRTYLNEAQNNSSLKSESNPYITTKSLPQEAPRRYSNDNQNSSSIKSEPNTYVPQKSLPHEAPRRFSNENQNIINSGRKDSSYSIPPKSFPPESNSISYILKSEPSPFVPIGKTVIFKGEALSPEKNIQPIAPQDNNEKKNSILHQDIRRSYSTPRPTGFRPQGITVQFSGRDASEETRKDALRKLGLLKEKSF
ncbi:hypothetical protein XENTR_v10008836 [Xenopus tropicalis]|uniref:LOC100036636 protein n=1 Tax=Xenopus tropicalis TaxID=8364 RepID=A0JP91_XENTR|nr:proline and serine-rich protein 2 [Xenopus tropicalis]XP_031753351.1 proline and serine-rich protein 2 isoform X1 [Xenopus tropicalis]AAI27304.1 LOC100036636 protein [Xenopus tropicalis]KAE8616558.1 hypothetical protein XENTR_v10008836 [Xenopus tropicalis]KAE8616559.1 hypothetical protein XENTR_v10008836 [Xenopus tropicalis]|eukprot:NP_001090664.1 proline and serine-rich protein 2 [Xenopus tropicalis]